MTARGFVVALLGAESTGKTTLANALANALANELANALPNALATALTDATEPALAPASVAGERRVAIVPEFLREFCDRERRTPRQEEQIGIAAEQTRRVAHAASAHDVVIADTTALQIAVYSDQVFGDKALYAEGQASHRRGCDLTLLTALDLPWQADGLQRDGPHVREPIDAKLRRALQRAGAAYSVISGHGDARLRAALACIDRAMHPPHAPQRWAWHCERCGDPACERLTRLRSTRGASSVAGHRAAGVR